MKFETFKKLVENHIREKDIRDEYLDKIPSDLQAFVYNNEYSESLENTLSRALELLLTEDLYGELEWFNYEWRPGFSVWVNGEENVIRNIDDYWNYLKRSYVWD